MPADLALIARRLFDAYGEGDVATVRSLLADDMVAWITNADADVDRVDGADGFMARLPDTTDAQLQTMVTQVVQVDDAQVLTGVAIEARRGDRTLHNFAGFLTRIADGRVQELWMVEAQPAYSDEFWST